MLCPRFHLLCLFVCVCVQCCLLLKYMDSVEWFLYFTESVTIIRFIGCMVDLNFLFLLLCGSDIKKWTSLFEWSIRFSPLPISAVSGTGTGELLDLVCSGLKKIEVCMSKVEYLTLKEFLYQYCSLMKLATYLTELKIFCWACWYYLK